MIKPLIFKKLNRVAGTMIMALLSKGVELKSHTHKWVLQTEFNFEAAHAKHFPEDFLQLSEKEWRRIYPHVDQLRGFIEEESNAIFSKHFKQEDHNERD